MMLAWRLMSASTELSPNGQDVTRYRLPNLFATNECFGGPDLRPGRLAWRSARASCDVTTCDVPNRVGDSRGASNLH